MGDAPEIPEDWTETERWAWQRIAAGEIADLNARDRHDDPKFENLDPRKEEGWGENRRLRAAFLQTILTQKAFADATPHGGVRILGALVDDAPLNLEHARLQRLFWLEKSRILVVLKGRNLRIDGQFSLKGSFAASGIELPGSDIGEGLYLNLGDFHGPIELTGASIGSNLQMAGSTFERRVDLNGATVNSSAFLRSGATFKDEVDLTGASIGENLEMNESTFEGRVNLNGATVNGSAFLRGGATFKGEVDLTGASIGSGLDMGGSTFEGRVNLNSATVSRSAFLRNGATFKDKVDLAIASIGANLEMGGSTFEGPVRLNRATVNGSALLSGGLGGDTIFEGKVDIVGASVGQDIDFSGAKISREIDLTGCKVAGELRLGSAQHQATRWAEGASLVLRNTHVGALQDIWRDKTDNAWPETIELDGFAYDRLGGLFGEGEGADMLARPVASYIAWLGRDPTFSPQPYEQLARFFRRAGEPGKADAILYEARERRRRRALSKVDDHGRAKERDLRQWLGLSVLRWTIGYGLGDRYFRVLWWVGGFTAVGALLLFAADPHSLARLPSFLFASLDQLLPIITLDKAHDTLVFGNAPPRPYWILAYFYLHKLAGWVFGSFIVAGLAGLTQRN